MNISKTEFEALVQQAFERWQTVDCGRGESPGFAAFSVGVVNEDAPYTCLGSDQNRGIWLFTYDWHHSEKSFGNTGMVFAPSSGKVIDADVELNLDRILKRISDQDLKEKLLSIFTHEAGHVLGLAHSEDESAVMAETYSDAELLTKQLMPDDIDAICDVFPPEGFPEMCDSPVVPAAALDDVACQRARQEQQNNTASRPKLRQVSCSIGDPGFRAAGPKVGDPGKLWLWVYLGGVFGFAMRRSVVIRATSGECNDHVAQQCRVR